jgi:hypothetical protein
MRTLTIVALLALGACGDDGAGDDGGAAGDASTTNDASSDAGRAIDAPASDATPFVCDFGQPQGPPSSVLWAAPLSGTGAQTLGGHSHYDGHGPVGYCPGARVNGQPFYELIAVGFETDTDIDGDGEQFSALPPGFWRDAQMFTGYGESAGRVNIYVDIVDEVGTVLNTDSNPEIRLIQAVNQGPELAIPLTSKPANEFQTNMPMTGGARYAVSVEGASDQVINMRLPVNHHVTYCLVFRRMTD